MRHDLFGGTRVFGGDVAVRVDATSYQESVHAVRIGVGIVDDQGLLDPHVGEGPTLLVAVDRVDFVEHIVVVFGHHPERQEPLLLRKAVQRHGRPGRHRDENL